MGKHPGLLAGLCALLLTCGLTGVAFAGNPHGTPPGQGKQGSSGNASSQNTAQSQTAPGVKPSSTTKHDTQCTTGGGTGTNATCSSATSSNPDASKRYGNGKTAAQIANSRGAPAGTQIKGPGNSQPHKVCRNGHWVDVHAVKSYGSSTSCGSSQASSSSAAGNAASSSSSAASSSSASSGGSAGANTSSSGGVLGATAKLPAKAKAAAKKPAGSVLGARASLRSSARGGTLPFTGLPLWAPALLSLVLLAGGLGLRYRPGRPSL